MNTEVTITDGQARVDIIVSSILWLAFIALTIRAVAGA
jgi:hypothetical protein